jgi:polysaccharide pyruvyl transferase WcaK-like protein
MKTVLYICGAGRGRYEDDVAYMRLMEFILENYRGDIKMKLLSVNGDKKFEGFANLYDFYLIGGGTCITNRFRPYADQIVVSLSELDLRYGLFGVSTYLDPQPGPQRTILKRQRNALLRAEFFSVRDSASVRFLNAWLGTTEGPELDIGICHDPGLTVKPRDTYGINCSDWHDRVVGINLQFGADDSLGTIRVDRKQYLRRFTDFITKFSTSYTFLHVPFNDTDTYHDRQLEEHGVICLPYTTPDYTAGFVSLCDYFVGTRLHADVTATALEIPFIPLCGSEANYHFLEHIGFSHRDIVMPDDVSNGIVFLEDEFLKLQNNPKRLSQPGQLKKVVQKARQDYHDEAHRLCRCILEQDLDM